MFIHKKKRAVVFKMRNPSRITTVIPTAKHIDKAGYSIVAVPHRPDETRVLRNLGFEVPDPMPIHYEWPKANGRFDPFEAQRITASFLTMHGRAFCLNSMGCVDADTEYLSPTGWKRIADYDGGEVAQYHPDTKLAEFVVPTEFVKLPCEEMLSVKTTRGIDQMLSPEHRVLLQSKSNPNKREVVQAAELWVRQNSGKSETRRSIGWADAAIPVAFHIDAGGIPLSEAQIRLQVAVVADGHFPSRTKQCIVRLKRERKKIRMRELLKAAGVAYTERTTTEADGRVDVGYTLFKFEAPLRDKEFGPDWWRASAKQLSVITDEVVHWDGTAASGNRGPRFTSTSKASADFVQYAFAATGNYASITVDNRPYSSGACYTVQARLGVYHLGLCGVAGNGKRTEPIQPAVSPDGFKYCFVVPSTFLVFRRNNCIFLSGNTGKTNSALWAYDYLREVKQANKVLVVCPLSTMERTWGDSVFSTFPHLDFAVLHGTRDRRLKLLKSDVHVYIINIDGVRTIADELAKRPDIDLIIIDELAMARNQGTARWKVLNEICNKQCSRRVWGMTGSPTPNSPTDAWAQCKLVTPDNPGVPKYFGRFRDMVMRQVTQFKWVPRAEANEVIHKMMQPAIRFSLDDCTDLPEQLFMTRDVEMTTEQKHAYKDMLNKLSVEMAGGQILAVNEAVKANKLIQIACGVAYDTNGNTVVINNHHRIEAVKELIEESEGKVIVFVPLTGALEFLANELRKDWTVEVVHGETTKAERDQIFKSFQTTPDPRVLVANATTMSHGLTLTAATTIVWYAPVHSNEVYEQACARVRRPGQTRTTVIAHIAGSDIERRVYKRLQEKQSMQGVLLEMMKEGRDNL